MKPGDTFTLEGIHELYPNFHRRWWQFWKPKLVKGAALRRFKVAKIEPPLKTKVWSAADFRDSGKPLETYFIRGMRP